MANNVFGYLNSADFQSRELTADKLQSLFGGNQVRLLVHPPGLGGVVTNPSNGSQPTSATQPSQLPFVLFAPTKRVATTLRSLEFPRVVDTLPSPAFGIALPIPTSALKTEYAVNYDTTELGGISSNILGGIKEASTGASFTNVLGLFGATIANPGATAGIVNGVTSGLLLEGMKKSADDLIRRVSEKMSGGVLSNLLSTGGLADNPFAEVLFKDVQFRTHNFEWSFHPRNQTEARVVDEIIQLFKFYMLPTREKGGLVTDTDTFFGFPYEFQITYSVQDTTFTLMPSVLESMSVSYGDGYDSPRFFTRGTNNKQYATKTTITLRFKEIVILTRDTLVGSQASPDVVSELSKDRNRSSVTRFRF